MHEGTFEEVMLGRTSQEVRPGGASGEVRLTSSGSDAGAFAPGTNAKSRCRDGLALSDDSGILL
jgi:hypothetical protein